MNRRQMLLRASVAAACAGGWLPAAPAQQPAAGARPKPKAPVRPVNETAPAAAAGLARPNSDTMLAISPEVENLLAAWEKQSATVERLHGEFVRYVYDTVYFVEKRSTGEFWYQSPDQGRMDFEPAELKQLAPKKNSDGQPYTVQADVRQRWICNGQEVFIIQDDEKLYDLVQIPPQQQGKNIVQGPLPFLFGMKAEQAKERYHMTTGVMHRPRGQQVKNAEGQTVTYAPQIHLVVAPKTVVDKREWTRAELLLDPQKFLPISVRLLDPTGTKETVYLFFPNKKMWVNEAIWFPNPLNDKPPRGYTKATDQRAAEEPVASPQMNKVVPAGAQTSAPAQPKPGAVRRPAAPQRP